MRRALPFLMMTTAPAIAYADAPNVATDILPIHGLVARVMQDVGTPDLIVPPGASPHGHSLRPSEARAIADADLVFWVGDVLSPWLEKPIETLGENAHVIMLETVEGTKMLPFREIADFGSHDDHDEHDHDKHEDHAEHDHDEHEHDKDEDHAEHDHDAHDDHAGHDHSGDDPHMWLSPANAKLWLDVIAEELAEHDGANAATYAANAQAAKSEIDAALASVTAQFEGLTDRSFLVQHDSYQYLEMEVGISPVGALTLSDAASLPPSELAEVKEMSEAAGVVCVLTEPGTNPGLVTALFGDSVRQVVADPLGRELPQGAGFYPALLEDLGASISACLKG
ncbi:zinc ABC transporter substrate-binding protein [Roseobacteraceae bacterium S113]